MVILSTLATEFWVSDIKGCDNVFYFLSVLVLVVQVRWTINLYKVNTLPRRPARTARLKVLNGFVMFSHRGEEGGGTGMEGAGINFTGKSLKFRAEGDLWLMNRKVSINQVVVEVNYLVVRCKNKWVGLQGHISTHGTPRYNNISLSLGFRLRIIITEIRPRIMLHSKAILVRRMTSGEVISSQQFLVFYNLNYTTTQWIGRNERKM